MTSQANCQLGKCPFQPPTQAAPLPSVAPSALAPQPSPPPKFVISKCPKNSTIVKVLRPSGTYYAFEYCHIQHHLIPHVCTCQPRVIEASLQPLYSTNSVLFVFNTVTQNVEQYDYNFETDTFEQLEDTGLIYNSAIVSQSPLITTLSGPHNEQVLIERDNTGSLRKQMFKDGGYKIMAPSKVITLMVKSIENRERSHNLLFAKPSDSDSDEESEEHDKYIGSLKQLTWCTCPHAPNRVIIVFNYTKEQYDSFTYCDVNAKFVRSECTCEFKVREYHLIPKYGERSSDNRYVIHVHNVFTNSMEKYVYESAGFKQVTYPELMYNPARATNTTTILTTGGGVSNPIVVISRDSTGKFKKEQLCYQQDNYIPLCARPVNTFLVQRKEARKKKKDAEKAKRAQEKAAENQVVEMPEAVVVSEDAVKLIGAPKSVPAKEQVVEKPETAVKSVDAPKEASVTKEDLWQQTLMAATAANQSVVVRPKVAVKPVDAPKEASGTKDDLLQRIWTAVAARNQTVHFEPKVAVKPVEAPKPVTDDNTWQRTLMPPVAPNTEKLVDAPKKAPVNDNEIRQQTSVAAVGEPVIAVEPKDVVQSVVAPKKVSSKEVNLNELWQEVVKAGTAVKSAVVVEPKDVVKPVDAPKEAAVMANSVQQLLNTFGSDVQRAPGNAVVGPAVAPKTALDFEVDSAGNAEEEDAAHRPFSFTSEKPGTARRVSQEVKPVDAQKALEKATVELVDAPKRVTEKSMVDASEKAANAQRAQEKTAVEPVDAQRPPEKSMDAQRAKLIKEIYDDLQRFNTSAGPSAPEKMSIEDEAASQRNVQMQLDWQRRYLFQGTSTSEKPIYDNKRASEKVVNEFGKEQQSIFKRNPASNIPSTSQGSFVLNMRHDPQQINVEDSLRTLRQYEAESMRQWCEGRDPANPNNGNRYMRDHYARANAHSTPQVSNRTTDVPSTSDPDQQQKLVDKLNNALYVVQSANAIRDKWRMADNLKPVSDESTEESVRNVFAKWFGQQQRG